jgi:hypothetical protein
VLPYFIDFFVPLTGDQDNAELSGKEPEAVAGQPSFFSFFTEQECEW